MKNLNNTKRLLIILSLLATIILLPAAMTPAATITTLETEYEPSSTVTYTGSGFTAGERVNLSASGSTNGTQISIQTTAADDGDISGTFDLPAMYEATYTLTATGASSGLEAIASFSDPVGQFMIFAPSSPVTLDTAATQVFTVSAKSTGGGAPPIAGVPVTWSISDPSGTLSSPSPVDSAHPDNYHSKTGPDGKTSITYTAGSTPPPAGTYYTVTATAYGAGPGGNDKVAFWEVSLNAPSNMPPVADAGGPYSINEGGTVQLTGSGSDPDGSVASYEWDLNYDGITFDVEATGTSPMFSAATLDGPSSRTVALRVTDDDGATTIDTATVSILNVPPTPSIGGAPTTSPEGTQISLTGSATDPSTADTAAGFTFARSVTKDGAAFASGSGTSFDFTPDDNGSYVVTLSATDKDDGEGTTSVTITVTNVDPTITGLDAVPNVMAVNNTTTVTATFTDPGTADTHTCTFSWDDGLPATNGTVSEAGGSGSCTGTRTYTAAGVYAVTVTVTDDDGGSAADTYEFVVVYDPSAGFVTGGGWINSPPGAYIANPSLVGKANFGFVSKYKKGASLPDGSTEFQFKAGDLNFHSSSYQWLVVSGPKAQYKGVGTINGAGNYGFLLTATDGQINGGGGVDKFRIKIWDKDSADAIVYDNAPGSDDIDKVNPQAIGGGSIVVHK